MCFKSLIFFYTVVFIGCDLISVLGGYNNSQPNDSHYFLSYIFEKYGNTSVMTFEGLEHLMESLGLGHLKFEKSHNISVHKSENGLFEDVHDKLQLHEHNHKIRKKRTAVIEPDSEKSIIVTNGSKPKSSCLSPQELLVMYGLEPNHEVIISRGSFLHMCPAIIYELDQRSCLDTGYPGSIIDRSTKPKSMTSWLCACGSVLVISICGLLGVALVPLLQTTFYNQLLNFLVALAVGTLCGDSFLHLIPHALEVEKDLKDHSAPVLRGGFIFLSLTFFFFLEALYRLRRVNGNKASAIPVSSIEAEHDTELGSMLSQQHEHSHHVDSVGLVAWMVIMGDGLHNLTDGLAIGAAFANNLVAGFSTALAVFTHELPHELGDFAVLLKSGMSVQRALFYNIVSSVLSIIGMAAGLCLGSIDLAANWIYAATAGSFIYIALADLVPEMNKNCDGSKTNMFLQVIGILMGGSIMCCIALYESSVEYILNHFTK